MKPRISESEYLERKHKVQGFMEDPSFWEEHEDE